MKKYSVLALLIIAPATLCAMVPKKRKPLTKVGKELRTAVLACKLDDAKKILKKGADIYSKAVDGKSVLERAILSGCPDLVRHIAATYYKGNIKDMKLLHTAGYHGRPLSTSVLIELGVVSMKKIKTLMIKPLSLPWPLLLITRINDTQILQNYSSSMALRLLSETG